MVLSWDVVVGVVSVFDTIENCGYYLSVSITDVKNFVERMFEVYQINDDITVVSICEIEISDVSVGDGKYFVEVTVWVVDVLIVVFNEVSWIWVVKNLKEVIFDEYLKMFSEKNVVHMVVLVFDSLLLVVIWIEGTEE